MLPMGSMASAAHFPLFACLHFNFSGAHFFLYKWERKHYNSRRTEEETLDLQPFLSIHVDTGRCGEKPPSSQRCQQPRRACDGDSEGALCHTEYISMNSRWGLGKRHLPSVRPWAGQCVLRTTSPQRCWLGCDALSSQLLRDHFWTKAGYSVLRVYVWGCRTGCRWNPRSVSPSTQAIQSKSPQYGPYLRKKWLSLYLLKTLELLICWLHASLAMHAQAFHLVFCPEGKYQGLCGPNALKHKSHSEDTELWQQGTCRCYSSWGPHK